MSNQPPQDRNDPVDPVGFPPMPHSDPAPDYGQQPPYGSAPPPPPPYGSAPPPPPQPPYGQPPTSGQMPPYGQPPAYGHMPPAAGDLYPAAGPANQPASIARAVLLMKVGAALSALGLLVSLLTMGSAKELIRKAGVDAGTPFTEDQVTAAAAIVMAVAVLFGLVGIGLWLWMASANGKGKKWARVVATVLFVLSLLSGFASLGQRQTPPLTIILSLVSIAVGAYILVLLYKKESTAFYDARSGVGPR